MDTVYVILKSAMRWDQIAYAGYGDISYMSTLLAANPDIPPYGWVPKGVQVACPIIPDAGLTPLVSSLPAWKQ